MGVFVWQYVVFLFFFFLYACVLVAVHSSVLVPPPPPTLHPHSGIWAVELFSQAADLKVDAQRKFSPTPLMLPPSQSEHEKKKK